MIQTNKLWMIPDAIVVAPTDKPDSREGDIYLPIAKKLYQDFDKASKNNSLIPQDYFAPLLNALWSEPFESADGRMWRMIRFNLDFTTKQLPVFKKASYVWGVNPFTNSKGFLCIVEETKKSKINFSDPYEFKRVARWCDDIKTIH